MGTSLFLLTALGMGLLISTVARVQFVAGQIAIIATFLPAFILSGFIFDISSMPPVDSDAHLHDPGALFRGDPADRLFGGKCLGGDCSELSGVGGHGDRFHWPDPKKIP